MPKPPVFPPFTAKPSPSSISSWVKRVSDQLKLYKRFNLDFQLDADTIITLAGSVLEQKDAAQWWDNNGDALVKLKSFDDFVACFCDAFLSANWHDLALINFMCMTQGSSSFDVFVEQMKRFRGVLKTAGNEYVVNNTVFKHHIFTHADPILCLHTMNTPGFRIHALKVDGLVSTMSNTWACLVAAGKVSAAAVVTPVASAAPFAAPVAAPRAAPVVPGMHSIAEVKEAGGCFHCRRIPSDVDCVPHIKPNCKGNPALSIGRWSRPACQLHP
uniref:Retrotransposon gag domain-containing protein n=1 Tax=Mycena chlorophos TaxID=658473 RepID=A0ABQ0KWV7_MYCCL|nr:predicted protein [Mycena chlorophos]